jgi:hypothetical protein
MEMMVRETAARRSARHLLCADGRLASLLACSSSRQRVAPAAGGQTQSTTIASCQTRLTARTAAGYLASRCPISMTAGIAISSSNESPKSKR